MTAAGSIPNVAPSVPQRPIDDPRVRAAAGGALILLGVGLATVFGRRSSSRADEPLAARASELGDYLRDHLSASDAGLAAADELLKTAQTAGEVELFERCVAEFTEERDVIRALLRQRGETALSPKRVLSQVSGVVARAVVRGGQDVAMRFRSLEALAVGIQAKRCLWRALHALGSVRAPGARDFRELEAMALRQWTEVEDRRLALARTLFGDGTWDDADVERMQAPAL